MNKPKILLFFPNTANEGVMPLAIGILSTIAKQNGYDVRYFETSFYQKRLTAGEERQLTGEFKPVDRQNVLQLLPNESMLKDLIAIIRSYKPDIIAVTANSLEYLLKPMPAAPGKPCPIKSMVCSQPLSFRHFEGEVVNRRI